MQRILQSCTNSPDIFHTFVTRLGDPHMNTVAKVKNYTKIVGDLWEDFCVQYLIKIENYNCAYKLQDCDEEILNRLGLKKRDVGIDIVAYDSENNPVAVQCKYRKKCQRLSWRDVATFDALAMRTGPYVKRIIMTTSISIHREGACLKEDVFMGKTHFESLVWSKWLEIAGLGKGNIIESNNTNLTLEEIRQKRIQKLSPN